MNSYSKNYTTKTSSIIILTLLLVSPLVAMVAIAPSLPVAHAQVAGTMTLSASTGIPFWVPQDPYEPTIGTFVTATGTGFPTNLAAGTGIDICYSSTKVVANTGCTGAGQVLVSTVGYGLLFPTIGGPGGTVLPDANGYFQVAYYVPTLAGGTYNVYAIYTPNGGSPVMTTSSVFTVQSAVYVFNDATAATTGVYGNALDVIAVGFGSGESLQLIPSNWWGGTSVGPTGSIAGSDQGVFEADAGVAYDPFILGEGVTSVGPPSLTSSYGSGPDTTVTTLSGTGYTASTLYSDCLSTTGAIATCIVASESSFTTTIGGAIPAGATVTVPAGTAAGTYQVITYKGVAVISDVAFTVIFDAMPAAFAVPSATSGSHSSEALGLSTGDIGTGIFSVSPSIILTSVAGGVCQAAQIISIATAAGHSFCISGTGFPATTNIATGSSITISKATTIESPITTDANGGFGNVFGDAPAAVETSSDVPVGLLTVVLDGQDFNLAHGNIVSSTAFGAGALVGSNVASGAALTQLFDLFSNSTSTGNVGDYLAVIGINLVAGAACAGPFTYGGQPFIAAQTCDGNGAFVAIGTIPAVAYSKTGQSIVDGSGHTVANSFKVVPSVNFEDQPAYTQYYSFGSTPEIFGSGFGPGELLTVTIWGTGATSGIAWQTIASGVVGLDGSLEIDLNAIGVAPTPDLAMGAYNINVSGSTKGNWAYSMNQMYIDPIQAGGVLSISSGNAGQTVAILTGGANGLHGLAANTAYNIMWDTTDNVGTFTSTPNGQVPIGTSFVVPAGTSGFHIVDIQAAGVSAIWGNQVTLTSQYLYPNGLLFDLLTSLIATPSVASGGVTLTLSGSGLPANTLLYVEAPSLVAYASFTSTSTGAVPAGVTFTIPQQYNDGTETGSVVTWQIVNAANKEVGEVSYVYAAEMTLSSISGPAGTTVTASGTGLGYDVGAASACQYDVVFNYAANTFLQDEYTGTVVGVILSNDLGTGVTPITIPASAAAGTYSIGLVSANGAGCANDGIAKHIGLSAGYSVLNIVPTFTVGGAPTGSHFAISGTPSTVSLGGVPFESVTYTNGGTAQITGIVIISIQNALGQTVYITTSTITPAAGQSETAFLDLGPLASGTGYSANIFVISTSGGSLSAPTPVSSITV
jgi:hypothetical protein